ncbi:protein of unknown function (plasmid) [Methylocella tundrae]|uniref:Uncharacterized protein n=1 Tax=Methylocella tundrae TaxID=227605 RepID=A0A4V6YUK7_METTU|nr:protein of unknown function [Methylocella tundrae]
MQRHELTFNDGIVRSGRPSSATGLKGVCWLNARWLATVFLPRSELQAGARLSIARVQERVSNDRKIDERAKSNVAMAVRTNVAGSRSKAS